MKTSPPVSEKIGERRGDNNSEEEKIEIGERKRKEIMHERKKN